DGSQSRDFVFVADVVAGLRAAMEKLEKGAFTHEVFNVGTGRAITINELAAEIVALGGGKSALKHAATREGEILHSYCDNRHATARLGFTPATPLAEGLRRTFSSHTS